MLYYLRDKQHYKTLRECFFDKPSKEMLQLEGECDGSTLQGKRRKIELFVAEINKMFDRYEINTCLRKIHMIAQMYLETACFTKTFEGRTEKDVPSSYPGGASFQGRGLVQITHDFNYLNYYDYIHHTEYYTYYLRNKHRALSVSSVVNNNDNDLFAITTDVYNNLKDFASLISTNLFYAADSSGWYVKVNNSKCIHLMDQDDTVGLTKAINGGDKQLPERLNFTKWLKEFFNFDGQCPSQA